MKRTCQLVTETTAIAIAIVEDDAIAREGLSTLLSQQPQLRVACSASDLSSPALLDSEVDVILANVHLMVGIDGKVPVELAELAQRAKIVATHVSSEYRRLADLVRVGVDAFVLKDASLAELVSTVRGAADGGRIMPPSLLVRLVSNLSRERESIFEDMTVQEQKIMRLITIGKSNKEIAQERCISPHTVKSHVRNIMEKLRVHTRLQIAAHVNGERRRAGIIALDGGVGAPRARGHLKNAAGM